MQQSILQYIPQRPPFVMIDELLHANESITQTKFIIQPENIFIEDNKFSEAGLLENMAQTAAAGKGYRTIANNEHVKVGYIGAVKNFEICALPNINDELITETTTLHHIYNVTTVKAHISCNSKKIAECEMKVFINEAK